MFLSIHCLVNRNTTIILYLFLLPSIVLGQTSEEISTNLFHRDSVIRQYKDSPASNYVNSLKTINIYDESLILKGRLYYGWNSTIWSIQTKVEYGYDPHGNKILEKYYSFVERLNKLVFSYETKWEYDINGNLILWISHPSKNEYTYNENGDRVSKISYEWNESENTWIPNFKEETHYNSNREIILISVYSWNFSDWGLKRKEEYVYEGNTVSVIHFGYIFHNSPIFKPLNKNVYEYDDKENLTKHIFYSGGVDTLSSFLPVSIRNYSYDINNNNTLEVKGRWDEMLNDWYYYITFEYAYDEYNNKTLFLNRHWSDSLEQWFPQQKIEWFYNSEGKETLYRYFEWSEVSGQWILFAKEEITYDIHKNLSIKIYSAKIDLNSPWEFVKHTYYYSDNLITSIDDQNTYELVIYPNPVVDNLNFKLSNNVHQEFTFVLLDIRGNEVLTTKISTSKSLNLKELDGGFYIYNIISNQGTKSGRLIKR